MDYLGQVRRIARPRASRKQARFADLYEQQFEFVWRSLRRLGVLGAETEDIAQEVWLVVHRQLDRLSPQGSPRPWLFTIARRIAWRHHRTTARAKRKRDAFTTRSRGATVDIREQVEAGEFLEKLLGHLPPEQLKVFVLAELLSMTGKEISVTLDVKQATVYSRLRLARKRLRELVGSQSDDILDLTKETDQPTRSQQRGVWALIAPPLGLGVPQPAVNALESTTALATRGLGEQALAAVVASPGAAGAASAAMVALVFALAAGHSEEPTAVDYRAPTEVASHDAGRPAAPLPVNRIVDPPGDEGVPPASSEYSEPPVGQPATSRRLRSSETKAGSSVGLPDTETRDSDDPLAREAALLNDARKKIARAAPQEALSVIELHAAGFQDSVLSDVRESLRVEVLCALGREEDAVDLAKVLSLSRPNLSVARVAASGCAEQG